MEESVLVLGHHRLHLRKIEGVPLPRELGCNNDQHRQKSYRGSRRPPCPQGDPFGARSALKRTLFRSLFTGSPLPLTRHSIIGFSAQAKDRTWDNAVIPTWLVDRPLPAEADANACIRDRRLRVAAVAPGYACP